MRRYVTYPLSLRNVEEMMRERGVPEIITIDKSSANAAAIESVQANACVDILMRQNH